MPPSHQYKPLRNVAATRMGALGVAQDVIARVLNHSTTATVTGLYNQYEYLEEKRNAVQTLGDHIVEIVT